MYFVISAMARVGWVVRCKHRYRSVRFYRDEHGAWSRFEPWMSTIVDVFRRSAREDTAYLLAAAGLLVLSGTGLLDRAMGLLDPW